MDYDDDSDLEEPELIDFYVDGEYNMRAYLLAEEEWEEKMDEKNTWIDLSHPHGKLLLR